MLSDQYWRGLEVKLFTDGVGQDAVIVGDNDELEAATAKFSRGHEFQQADLD